MSTALSAPYAFAEPRPSRGSLTWTVTFSIFVHIAAGWFFISRFVIEHTEPPPLEISMIPMTARAPPKPVAPPPVDPDKPLERPDRPRETISHPTVPAEPHPRPPVPGPAAPTAGPILPGPVAPPAPQLAPAPTSRVMPVYPRKAEEREIPGTATIYVTVGEGGDVLDAVIASESPENYGFGEAAAKAVRRWKFADAQPGQYRVVVKFKL